MSSANKMEEGFWETSAFDSGQIVTRSTNSRNKIVLFYDASDMSWEISGYGKHRSGFGDEPSPLMAGRLLRSKK